MSRNGVSLEANKKSQLFSMDAQQRPGDASTCEKDEIEAAACTLGAQLAAFEPNMCSLLRVADGPRLSLRILVPARVRHAKKN